MNIYVFASDFASEHIYIYISKCYIDVINYGRKLLLFDGSHTSIPGLRKKEVCLMRPWLLMMELECASLWAYKCEIQYPKSTAKDNFGLYHEDGLAVLKIKVGGNQNR